MKTAVIDYGMGNLLSVCHGIRAAGGDAVIVERGDDLRNADAIILPGVGAFGKGMEGLRARGFDEALDREVRQGRKPFLGICLGMQLLARRGLELGEHEGLGWFNADVRRLEPGAGNRVPHIGWNDVDGKGVLFESIPKQTSFYFVHSFHLVPDDANDGTAYSVTEHGTTRFVAAIARENVLGAQFHPEKSHKHGITLLRNFLTFAGKS